MGSHYVSALKLDPDFAARAIGSSSTTPSARPEGWTLEIEMLALVADRIGIATALLADLPIAGKRRANKPPKPIMRPITAIEHARIRASEQHLASIDDDVQQAQQRWLDAQEGSVTSG